jgi:hypothetical protein
MLLHNNYSHDKSMLQYLITEINRGSTNSRYGDTPILVTFDNIEDVNSVREVDRNAVGRTLGPGYGPVSMTLTAAKERATQGTLAKKFPALHSALTAPPPPPPPPTPAWKREREKKEQDAEAIAPTTRKLEPVRPPSPRISWGAFDAHPRP